MSDKLARGTKRTCQSCSNRFYDLNHDPIVCPICSTPFVLTAVEVAAIAAEAAKPKAKAPMKEKVFAIADAPLEGADLPEMESTEALAEIEAEDGEIADGEVAEDTFLEPEEGDESSVADLIDSPVEGEEET